MTVNSPLGKYAQIVAALAAVFIIGSYVLGALFEIGGAPSLRDAFLIAIGAVFGSAAGVNGWKRDMVAVHKRLDEAGIGAAGDGHA